MIFTLDATPLSVPTGGIRRYTSSISQALATEFPDDHFHLLSDQPFTLDGPSPANLHSGTIAAKRWWSWSLPRTLANLNASLFHGTDFSVPYVPTRPSVLTLHDLSPWRKDCGESNPRIRRRTPILLRTGIATMVITPSEAIRREAIHHFNLKPERVVAIPLAASELFKPVQTGPRPRPYFLFVGTLAPRKNIERMIEAWREVSRMHEVDLILAGRSREDSPNYRAATVGERSVTERSFPQDPGFHLLGAVPDDALPALYSGAAAVLYPSLYEGFGLPVLEAMQCGALVITSRDPALVEVTGLAALHVGATETHSLVNAMTAALLTTGQWPNRLQEVRERAVARAKEFSWSTTARKTREVYDEAIRVFSRT
jgi:glycosyltransferase involved in cell wall biosynthesis